MIVAYVADQRSREREEGYIRGMLSALRKLQAGINVRWHADMVFVPADLWATASEPRFGYDPADARRIIAQAPLADADVGREVGMTEVVTFPPRA